MVVFFGWYPLGVSPLGVGIKLLFVPLFCFCWCQVCQLTPHASCFTGPKVNRRWQDMLSMMCVGDLKWKGNSLDVAPLKGFFFFFFFLWSRLLLVVVVGGWSLAAGYLRFVFGCWWLVVRVWRLVVGCLWFVVVGGGLWLIVGVWWLVFFWLGGRW